MGPTTSVTARPRLLSRRWDWVAFGLAMLAVLTFLYWTAATSGGLLPRPIKGAVYTDQYNLLLHGMLKGHLYLDVPVDPAMLSSPNPYDPKVWVPHGWMIDTSFYHGKYYIYYGVVPLLVFMLPFRLLTGGDLWLGTAGELSTVLAFLALVWLWLRIRRDYFPRTGSSIVFASILAIGFVSELLSLARRPMMYELAIASGCLFGALMLHCVYSALRSPRRAGWMLTAGFCLGLAFGSRPTYLLTILAPGWVLLHFLGRERPRGFTWASWGPAVKPALAFAVGFGVPFVGVLVYNDLRFSSPFDFGYNYLLQDPVADLKHIWGPSYFWFNLKNYYLHGLEWTRYFPFATTSAYPPSPKGFYGLADVYGILKYAPIVWFLVAAPFAWRKAAAAGARDFGAAFGLVFLAYLGPGVLLLFFGTSFPRYEVDFLPCLVIASALAACVLDQALVSRVAKRVARTAWFLAALFSVIVGGIMSIPLEGTLNVQKGNTYFERVARVMNYPTFLYERARGWHYGPVTWRMSFPRQPPNTQEKLIQTPNATLLMEHLTENKVRFGLQSADVTSVLWGGGVEVAVNKVVTVSASFGSLYPTAEHPYYLKHDANAIGHSSVFVTLDGRPVLQALRPLDPVPCEAIRIADGDAKPGWFSGRVLKITRNQLSAADITPDFTPRSLHVDVPANLPAGRWPLISAGTETGGDLLFLDIGTGNTARFGYFSSGSPVQYSTPVAIPRGTPLTFAVRMEALEVSGRTAGPERPLSVERDGRELWLTQAPYHACSADSIQLGANAVSAPSVETAFPGAMAWIDTPARPTPTSVNDHLFLRVVFPAQTRWGLREPLLITGVPGAYDGIHVVHYGNGQGRFVLDHYGRLNQEGPFLENVGGESLHDIEIITPVFASYHGSRDPLKRTIVVKMDGKEVLRFDTELYPAQLDEATVGENHFGGPAEKHFVGALLMQRWVECPAR